MTFRSCAREQEIRQALKAGIWPEACGSELRAHVESCTSCNDFVLVTETFQGARVESSQEAASVPPGLLWWRAQLRRRNAVTEQVSKPMAVAQTFAWIVMATAVALLFVSQHIRWAAWWSEFSPSRLTHAFMHTSLDWNLAILIPGLAIIGLMGGVVVYLASDRR